MKFWHVLPGTIPSDVSVFVMKHYLPFPHPARFSFLYAVAEKRYGTGPLRRYIDILAQRQMAAILRGTGYLNKQDLIETVSVRAKGWGTNNEYDGRGAGQRHGP